MDLRRNAVGRKLTYISATTFREIALNESIKNKNIRRCPRGRAFQFQSSVRVCTLELRRCTLDPERAAFLPVALNLLICRKIT